MNTFLKMFAVSAVSWGISMVISFAMIIITAGVTEKWGTSSAGSAMMVMLGGVCLVFVAGTVAVHFLGRRVMAGQGSPWLYTLLHSAASVVTLGVLAFVTMVLFNR